VVVVVVVVALVVVVVVVGLAVVVAGQFRILGNVHNPFLQMLLVQLCGRRIG
jgi:uncharacterized membrane protein HdeD (DUF308 family)